MKWLKCKSECCGCGACAQICPQKCILMEMDKEGFLYPVIDENLCVKCGLCKNACPILHRRERTYKERVYAACSKDEKLLCKSSSGGMFGVLARYIIQKEGIVFGCCFNEELEVIHCSAENESEYEKFHGSKYVQSNTGNTYRECRQYLENGKYVLYSGTPCQIAGLKQFLRKEYEALITVEVICHGVPSPGLWKKYISELEKCKDKKIVNVAFRYQDQGWKKYRFRTEFADGNEEIISGGENPFLRGFFNHLTLRPSCYNCKCRLDYSQSDFMIGDFWGIEKYHEGFDEKLGVSVLIVLSEKGEKVFREIKQQMAYVEAELKEVVPANGCVQLSVFPNRNRTKVYDIYNESGNVTDALGKYAINYAWKQKQYRLGVWGSYNSRLVSQFLINNSAQKRVFHYSNSSVISVMSDRKIFDDGIKMENQYRKEALLADWNKSFRYQFETITDHVDYLLIDMLEERFDLVQSNNTYITNSDAFIDLNSWKAEAVISQEKLWNSGIWNEKMQQYVEMLLSRFSEQQIIVMEVYLNEVFFDGRIYSEFTDIQKIRKMNHMLKKIYDLFFFYCPGAYRIKISKELQYSDYNHRYGCFPYHLNYEACFELADQVYNIMVGQDE